MTSSRDAILEKMTDLVLENKSLKRKVNALLRRNGRLNKEVARLAAKSDKRRKS